MAAVDPGPGRLASALLFLHVDMMDMLCNDVNMDISTLPAWQPFLSNRVRCCVHCVQTDEGVFSL